MISETEKAIESIDFSFLENPSFDLLGIDIESLKKDVIDFIIEELFPKKIDVFRRKEKDEIQRVVEEGYGIHIARRLKVIRSIKKSEWDMDGECRKRWIRSLFDFEDFLSMRGYDVSISSDIDWYSAGYNIIARRGTVTFRFKLKTREKFDRKDENVDDDWVWIEIVDITGQKGWIYKDADIIVLETEKGYLFVDRKKLLQKIEPMIDRYLVLYVKIDIFKHFVLTGKIPMYSRRVRKEEVALVPMKIVAELGNYYEKQR
jgi:hypothetical protein